MNNRSNPGNVPQLSPAASLVFARFFSPKHNTHAGIVNSYGRGRSNRRRHCGSRGRFIARGRAKMSGPVRNRSHSSSPYSRNHASVSACQVSSIHVSSRSAICLRWFCELAILFNMAFCSVCLEPVRRSLRNSFERFMGAGILSRNGKRNQWSIGTNSNRTVKVPC
jgi:hypothetical protein